MSDHPLTSWKKVAELLAQGWRVKDNFHLQNPATGEVRDAWGNAIKACRKRGLIPEQPE